MKTIVWFRNDLRLRDNPALFRAAEQGEVIPVFILDTVNNTEHFPGQASQWWLYQSLISLNQSLSGQLVTLAGDPRVLLPQLSAELGAAQVVWNRGYEPWQMLRDSEVKELLLGQGIRCQSFNGCLLWEPWKIHKSDGTPYKVFTPYYRKGCLGAPAPRLPLPQPPTLKLVSGTPSENLHPHLVDEFPWYEGFPGYWNPGESGASQNLELFLHQAANEYRQLRDRPDKLGTSRLSPHIHFGEISANQIWYASMNAGLSTDKDSGLDTFLSELGWREFAHYLLFHFPQLPEENFQAKFDRFTWQFDGDKLAKWKTGRTGIPIVDAGMRQLWQTGYIHNRVRMVVASFLTKNLRMDWRLGANWFWNCLLDGDLAVNSASWQWVAGSGADAAPYFRIFNPVSQGQKFDPDGQFVKQYCPELSGLEAKYIHRPWEAPEQVLADAGVHLGREYPEPIVDLKHSRQQALDAFALLKTPA